MEVLTLGIMTESVFYDKHFELLESLVYVEHCCCSTITLKKFEQLKIRTIKTEYVTSICSRASQTHNVLTRVSKYMSLQTRCSLMESFITSQFNYCPIVWMCHSRSLNNKVNRIHESALHIVYQGFQSSFSALLVKDNSFTIHQKICNY